MIDVYIYESEAERESGERASEAWEDVPCAPRIGETIFFRRDLGTRPKPPRRRVVSVEWFNSKPTREEDRSVSGRVHLHAYVVVEPVPQGGEGDG